MDQETTAVVETPAVAAPVTPDPQPSYATWQAEQSGKPAPEKPKPAAEKPVTVTDDDEAETTPAISQEQEKPVTKPETPAQKRIRDLSAKNNDLERRLAALENPKQAEAPKPVELPKMPKLSDFDYDEDKFGVALANYTEKHTQVITERKLAEFQQQQMADARTRDFNQAVTEAEKQFPDFRTVAFDPEVIKHVTPIMGDLIMEKKDMALAYRLGQDSGSEAKRISALPPAYQLFEMGKLAGSISAKGKFSNTQGTTEAPVKPAIKAPVTLASGGGTATGEEGYKAWLKTPEGRKAVTGR